MLAVQPFQAFEVFDEVPGLESGERVRLQSVLVATVEKLERRYECWAYRRDPARGPQMAGFGQSIV